MENLLSNSRNVADNSGTRVHVKVCIVHIYVRPFSNFDLIQSEQYDNTCLTLKSKIHPEHYFKIQTRFYLQLSKQDYVLQEKG